MGGWVGKIKIKDQLSPAEAEIRAELGNTPSFSIQIISASSVNICRNKILKDDFLRYSLQTEGLINRPTDRQKNLYT